MSEKTTSPKSRTDWNRVDSLADREIDLSDSPELTPELFSKAIVRKELKPLNKKSQITLRLDSDVFNWFRSQGKDYQTKINSLLRAYMKAHKPVSQVEQKKST